MTMGVSDVITQLAKLSFNHASVVFTANAFIKRKHKSLYPLQISFHTTFSAVSTVDLQHYV